MHCLFRWRLVFGHFGAHRRWRFKTLVLRLWLLVSSLKLGSQWRRTEGAGHAWSDLDVVVVPHCEGLGGRGHVFVLPGLDVARLVVRQRRAGASRPLQAVALCVSACWLASGMGGTQVPQPAREAVVAGHGMCRKYMTSTGRPSPLS